MKEKRVHRKIERTAEESARIKAVREEFQRDRPSLGDLLAPDEQAMTLQEYLDLQQALHALKKERERKGMTLEDISERSGMDRAAVSRLENGYQANPTINTVIRYASAVGKRVLFVIEDADERDKRSVVAR